MNLYELTTEAAHLAELMADEAITDEDAAEAAGLQAMILDGLLPAKVESYCHVIALLKRDAAALKAEEKRLADRRRVRENNERHMKESLHDALGLAEVDKVDAGNWTVTRCKTAASLLVGSEDDIPEEYYRQPPPSLDRKRLLDDVKAGKAVPGVQLVTDATHLRIK